jgi:hypothetical protein
MADDDDADDVLSRLPKTRPARRSTRRAPADGTSPTASAPAKAKAAPKRTAAKPTATAKAKAAAKAKPKTPPKPVAAAPPPPEPTPESVRKPIEPPSGSEILHTAVQAAGDIAQVGLVIGREALKAARSKLPGGRG